MTEGLIDRINELARKNKTVGLTPEEIRERDKLRKQYLKEFRESIKNNILENVYVVDENGHEEKLTSKKMSS